MRPPWTSPVVMIFILYRHTDLMGKSLQVPGLLQRGCSIQAAIPNLRATVAPIGICAKKNAWQKQDGIQSDVLAASIVRESGGDAIAIENDIIDFFRDLKKTEFRKQYTKHKNDLVMQDKLQEQQMKEEWDSQEQALY